MRRITELYGERTDREIARVLNSEGYRTGYGKAFTEGSVSGIRRPWGLTRSPAAGKLDDSLH